MIADREVPTVVVGASFAGLATSACLTRAGHEHVLLEQADQAAPAWRQHYERLHLHTPKGRSTLPFMRFGRDVPRYPSRQQVVDYLDRYVGQLALEPRFGERVTAIEARDDGWRVETAKARYSSRNVVVATGLTRKPFVPEWPDRARFRGEVLHSSGYKTGAPYRGKRVLVVGFGNSGGELALDLLEHDATPTLAVRSAVNVVPRDVLGLPILGVGAMLRRMPLAVSDALGTMVARLVVGNIEKLGLRKLPYGPIRQLREHRHVPFIDIGTIAQIRAGRIAVRGGLERFTTDGVRFADGQEEVFDAVIAATGYRAALADFFADAASVCDERGLPTESGVALRPGLYFCGFFVSARGMINEIASEAQRIAAAIAMPA